MRIALAQLQPGPDHEANRERAVDFMQRAADQGAQMIAFAELALHRFFPQNPDDKTATQFAETVPGPTTTRLARIARERSLVTIINLYERDESGRCFDSSPVIDADGSLLGVTRMVHIAEMPGFHEQAYYHPGDQVAPVYNTRAGRVGVAICYDRHFPEYTRALGVAGAEIVVIPQAGAVDEWPEGLYEAEVRTAAFHNGYFAALCNRVGVEKELTFAGESFVTSPTGQVMDRAPRGREELLVVDCDLAECAASPARQMFFRDRRPELYSPWLA